MIKVAVCDDSLHCSNRIVKRVKSYMHNKKIESEISVFTSGEDLLDTDVSTYDLIFLDVEMNGDNGIETARKIRKINNDVQLIYVSGLIQYAPAGYEVRASAYILKNDLESLFDNTMNDVIKELNFREEKYKFKCDDIIISLPLKNILYIESFNKTVKIHTINFPKHHFETRLKISDIANDLSSKGFLQVHKSFLVNMENVVKLKNYKVYLKNNIELNVSQRKWANIYATYVDWRGRI